MRLAILGALFVLSLHVPGAAAAQGEATARTGRAVVFLDADEGVEPFLGVFLYEVVAGRLRDHGFAVVRGDASAEASAPLTCLASRECARATMARRSAPFAIALHLAERDGRLTVTWARSDGVATTPLEGDEGTVAAALVEALGALEPARLPCVWTLEASVAATIEIDGARARAPGVVDPGSHRVTVRAPDRDPWSGPLTCAGARVLRVHAE
ncbi:MAG: hypothetical protein R3B82_19400 [Sandaracinaceae bacterium]